MPFWYSQFPLGSFTFNIYVTKCFCYLQTSAFIMLRKMTIATSKFQFSKSKTCQLLVCAHRYVFSSGILVPGTISALVHIWDEETQCFLWLVLLVFKFCLSCMADNFLLTHSPHACMLVLCRFFSLQCSWLLQTQLSYSSG